jgi:pregnancy-associated plasma protein-A
MAEVHRRSARAGAILGVILAMFALAIPAASARHLGGPRCLEGSHHHAEARTAATRAGRIPRDFVETPRRDPLQRWIDGHKAAARAAEGAGGSIVIPVAFHVIRKDATIEGGNIPRQWIEDQITVLNYSFDGTTGGVDAGIRFRLDSVERVTKKSWFHMIAGSSKDTKMKEALHVGGPETLNIYTAELGQFLLGYATFPWSYPRLDQDGVVLEFRSLPGSDFGPYDEGDTGTHEVGHWLGLFHTFQNGCEVPGDFIDDTPFEASPAFGCPEGRNTCAGGGADPITNFMDYTDDGCMFEFTDDQAIRMRQSWRGFRA